MLKTCTKCKEEKDTSLFYKRGYYKSGLISYMSRCKQCTDPSANIKIKCNVCGKMHSRFATGRKSNICETCYPRYRTCYSMLAAVKDRANKKNLKVDIDIEWVLNAPTHCPKTGFEFQWKDKGSHIGNRSPYAPSIDKIDPHKGYTKDNCQIVCWWYNVSKQQFSDEQVLELCKGVVLTQSLLS